jgi:hypothetical protein
MPYNFENKVNKNIVLRDVLDDEKFSLEKGKGLFSDLASDET